MANRRPVPGSLGRNRIPPGELGVVAVWSTETDLAVVAGERGPARHAIAVRGRGLVADDLLGDAGAWKRQPSLGPASVPVRCPVADPADRAERQPVAHGVVVRDHVPRRGDRRGDAHGLLDGVAGRVGWPTRWPRREAPEAVLPWGHPQQFDREAVRVVDIDHAPAGQTHGPAVRVCPGGKGPLVEDSVVAAAPRPERDVEHALVADPVVRRASPRRIEVLDELDQDASGGEDGSTAPGAIQPPERLVLRCVQRRWRGWQPESLEEGRRPSQIGDRQRDRAHGDRTGRSGGNDLRRPTTDRSP